MLRITIPFLALLLLSIPGRGATPATSADFAGLRDHVLKIKNAAGLPAATSVAVVMDGKVVFTGSYGFRDVERQLPADDDTAFYIASATKPLVALNALLDLDTNALTPGLTLTDMYPGLDIDGIDERDVGIEQLLSHTSGIDNEALVLATAFSGIHSPQSLEALVRTHSVANDEGQGHFSYANVGYNVYSVFADRHFGTQWQDRLDESVLAPAGMKHSSARVSTLHSRDIKVARTYSPMAGAKTTPLYLQKTDETMHAAGGVFSTARDLARFLVAELNSGIIDGKQVFPAAVIERSQRKLATTDAAFLDFDRDGYAWGWYTGAYKAQRMLHHFGGFAGVHAHLSLMPEKGIGLVVLNAEDFVSSRLTSVIADYVYGLLLGDAETESRVAGRVAALSSQVSGLDQMVAQQAAKIAAREMRLSLPMAAYEGIYAHPLLGSIHIVVDDDGRLRLSWGVMSSVATGFDEIDRVRITFNPVSGEIIRFNANDRVMSLTYSGETFVRRDAPPPPAPALD